MFDPNRRWQLTDAGAVTWFQIINTLNTQQVTIKALCTEVNRLKSLIAPQTKPLFPLAKRTPAQQA